MKKLILGALIAILITPSTSFAYTPLDTTTVDVSTYTSQESLEELRIILMKQIIALLQLRIQELIALRDGTAPEPVVLGIATSTEEEEVETRRRGGGGGSSRSNQAADEQAAINELQQTVEDLLAELGQLEEEQTTIEELQLLIESLKASLVERDGLITDFESEIDTLNNDIETLEGDNTALNTRIAELEAIRNTLQQTIQERVTEVGILEVSITELQQRLEQNEISTEELLAAQSLIESEKAALEVEVTTLSESAESQAVTIADLERQISSLQQTLAAGQQTNVDSMSVLQSQIETLQAQEVTLQAQVAALQENEINQDVEIESLNAEITELKTSIASLQTQITQQQEGFLLLVLDLEDEIAAKTEEVSGLELLLVTTEDTLSQIINDLLAQSAELEAENQTIKNQLDELEVIVTEQSNLLTQLLQLSSDLVDENEFLKGLVDTLFDQIANLQAQVEELQEEIDTPILDSNCVLPTTNTGVGATFTYCTETNPSVVGSRFVVWVGVDSATSQINAVDTVLDYDPAYLQVTAISKGGSDFSLWTTEPTYSNTDGLIEVGAGAPSPLQGISKLIAVEFTSVQTGTTTIEVSNTTEILQADGRGTDVYQVSPSPVYTIASSEPYEATLNFLASTNSPDATTLPVDRDDISDVFTVLVFELDAEEGPVSLSNVYIRLDTTNGVADNIIRDVELVIDGTTFNSSDVKSINGDTSAQLHLFELDDGIVIAPGVPVEAEVQVELKRQEGNYDVPQSVSASIDLDTRSLWEAEGYDDLNPATEFFGTVFGETHTLMVDGLLIGDVDTSTATLGENNTAGEFTIEFEVTAFEDDFYFTDNTGTTGVTNGIQYGVDGPDAVASMSAVVTSTADEELPGVYVIQEGETELVTLQVYIEVSETGMYRLRLESLFFANNFDGVTNTRAAVGINPTDLRTNYQAIQPSI